MRAILLFVFVIGFSIASFSQDGDRRPTQKEFQEQKQQAIAKAKRQREETIKHISEAKANNDGPERIKLLESQLATIDQMIAMLEKTDLTNNKTPKTLPPSKIKEPAYVSPFTPIKLKQSVKTPTWDQATDTLLFYSGRNIDANTLITPSGLIVRYDRQSNRVILQPPRNPLDSLYYNLVTTLGKTSQMKNDFAIRMESMLNSYFMFPEIEDAYKEYDYFRDRYYELAKNTIQLQAPARDGRLELMIQDLADYMRNLPPIKMIMPPKRPNDLCLCSDPTAKANYRSDLDNWQYKFYGEENKILEKLIAILQHLDFINQLGYSRPTVPSSINNPSEYCVIILERMKVKLEDLSNKYDQGDVLIEDGLTLATIMLMKKLIFFDEQKLPKFKIIRSAIVDRAYKIMDMLESDLFEMYIEAHKSLRTFNVVFDYGLYVAHELNKNALLAKTDVNQEIFKKWMEGLKKYNRFKLSVELDFHYQLASEAANDMVTMWANGFLQNEGDLYVSLGRHDCHWELFLSEVNHRNLETSGEEFRIKMKMMKGEKDYINDKLLPFSYNGPATLQMVFPTFKINFCGGQSEALMDVFTFSSADLKRHENDDPKKVYTIDILAYVNKVVLGVKKTEVNVNQLISIAGDMMNMNSTQLPESSGNPALDRLKMEYMMNKKKYDLQNRLSQTTHTGRTAISLSLNPADSSLLFDPTVDLADPNDEDRKMGIMLTKGIVTLKVMHSPN